jgi:UDP-N-acetylmuramyl pentapeptide synthase
MLELGSISEHEHLSLFKWIGESCIDEVYAVGNLTYNGFITLPWKKQGGWAKTASDVLGLIRHKICSDDVVLIKGSFSIGLHEVVAMLKNIAANELVNRGMQNGTTL